MNILDDIEDSGSGNTASNNLEPQNLNIVDKKELYKCFMPSIKGGGLFILTNDEQIMSKIVPGLKVFILLTLGEQKMKTPINGKVIWINRDGLNKGYGIAFGDTPAMKSLKDTIVTQIAEFSLKKEPTYTF